MSSAGLCGMRSYCNTASGSVLFRVRAPHTGVVSSSVWRLVLTRLVAGVRERQVNVCLWEENFKKRWQEIEGVPANDFSFYKGGCERKRR